MGKKSCFDFNVGEKVVYPGYGIGEVLKIEKTNLQGKVEIVLVVSFSDTENVSTVTIPETSVQSIGLRKPSSKITVGKALNFLKSGEPELFGTWKDRFAAHTNMVANGDLLSIAKVLKALHIQNKRKPLSFREKKLYQKCLLLISSEVAFVKGIDRQTIEKSIISTLDGK